MNVGSRTQMASIPGNESTRDTDMPYSPQRSALLYLFQEVSKLASPTSDTLSGTNSWLNDSMQGAAITRADPAEASSQKISMKMCQHGLPHVGHNCQEIKAKDKSSKVTTVVHSHVDSNSPWRVLSLINLQCEKLLHHTDGGESDLSFNSSCAKLSHSVNRMPNASTNFSDPHAAGVCISVECTLRPPLIGLEEEQNRPRFSSIEGACSTDVGSLNISQTAAQLDICRPVLVEENVPAASLTYCRHQTLAKVPSPRNSLSQTACLPHLSPRAWEIFDSNADASIILPVGRLASDDNANLVLIAAPSREAQRHHVSVQQSSLLIGTSDALPPVQSGKVATFLLQEDGTKDYRKSLSSISHGGENESSVVSQAEPSDVQMEQDVEPAPKRQRTKTPRKQAHPSRSADIQDPGFQGVMFRIDTELDDSREQCRLLITSKYR